MTLYTCIVVAAIWLLIGIKTWSFTVSDLIDGEVTRSTILASFFAGLFWPITYAALTAILIFGVNSKSAHRSALALREYWKNAER